MIMCPTMALTDFLTAVFLGFIEGLTEFIPVSSTGHLVVLVDGLGFPAPPGHVFEVIIQLGAIFAVLVVYRKKFIDTLIGLPCDKTAQRFALNLVVASFPALIAGALAHDFIKDQLYKPVVIAVSLIVGGIVILFLERRLNKERISSVDEVPLKIAFLIGCFQMIALVPGVSRSGATIMGALALGLSRPAAAELSFFLAVPVMFAAVSYDVLKNWDAVMAVDSLGLIAAGFFAAFLTALVVLKAAMHIISRWGFQPFAVYRIAVGAIILMLFF